jgi:hypothetical protein
VDREPSQATGSETAAAGVSAAGAQAIRGIAGFGFGPVIGVINVGLRDGAFAQDVVVQRVLGACTPRACRTRAPLGPLREHASPISRGRPPYRRRHRRRGNQR